MILAAIVNVISLKCVQHNERPKNVVTCIIKNKKLPFFHAVSCSLINDLKYIFLPKCISIEIKIKSTPLSCK